MLTSPHLNGKTAMDSPPPDAYDRVTNPERFAVLHPAARAMVEDLERRFDVQVERGEGGGGYIKTGATLTEYIRLVPTDPAAAPLVIGFTNFPGIFLRVGAWAEMALPACGCDACNDDPADLLEKLDEYVAATAAGALTERITVAPDPWLETQWEGDGWSSGNRGSLSHDALRELRDHPIQPPPGGRWNPWPLRT
nr:DUF6226 family protein [Rhodococcus oryzae]